MHKRLENFVYQVPTLAIYTITSYFALETDQTAAKLSLPGPYLRTRPEHQRSKSLASLLTTSFQSVTNKRVEIGSDSGQDYDEQCRQV